MKKRTKIFCAVLLVLGITTFVVINRNHLEINESKTFKNNDLAINTPAQDNIEKPIFTDFNYDVGSRFAPIKKGDLLKATSINDFFELEDMENIESVKSVSIVIIKNDIQTNIRETGYSKSLTNGQLKLLKTSDYSTNFLIRVEYKGISKETNKLEDNYYSPHLTVVPEKQAEYVSGKHALIEYLKVNSYDVTAGVEEKKLKPAKLYFTVNKTGGIENVKLDRSSNYPEVDKRMIELIENTPGLWRQAVNDKGEKVDQELVVSFGLMGC